MFDNPLEAGSLMDYAGFLNDQELKAKDMVADIENNYEAPYPFSLIDDKLREYGIDFGALPFDLQDYINNFDVE